MGILGVPGELLDQYGAVSSQVAQAMAAGARERLQADIATSVTGLAGPNGDDRGTPVGTVYIGYCDNHQTCVKEFFYRKQGCGARASHPRRAGNRAGLWKRMICNDKGNYL